MKKITFIKITVATFIFFIYGTIFSQDRIAVIQDSQVRLLNPESGEVIEPSFISLGTGTPKALLQVDDEIWITYQIGDKIERYDLDGILLNTISTGLDNVRGLAVVNDNEVWVCNSGTQNGAPGDAIIRYGFDGVLISSFTVAPQSDSPFDIIDNGNGEVYISYSSSNNIERRDYNGLYLGDIVSPGVVNFIQQIEIEGPGVILAAVFSIISGGNQNGLYRFSETDGSILDYFPLGNLRGVAKLGNGEILWSSAAGVSSLNPSTGVSEIVSPGSAQYFGRITFANCTTPPTPTGDPEQTFADGATLADIVVDPTDVIWFANELDAMNNTNPLPINTPLANGTIYYAVSIVDGCISDVFQVLVTVVLGVADFNSTAIVYYPNPTKGLVTFQNNENITEISIVNLVGQQVLLIQPDLPELTVDFTTFSKGTYLVKIKANSNTETIKIIKE